jgi:hypothetical protein
LKHNDSKETLELIIRTTLDNKFASLDRSDIDEVVQITILELLAVASSNPVFVTISEDFAIEMLQKCFTIALHERKTGERERVRKREREKERERERERRKLTFCLFFVDFFQHRATILLGDIMNAICESALANDDE